MSTICVLRISSSHSGTVEVLLDESDFKRYGGYKWHVSKGHYISRSYRQNGKIKKETLARLIMGALPDQTVRFKNNNPLDLRQSNLVLLENSGDYVTNQIVKPTRYGRTLTEARRSKYIGVVPAKHQNLWRYSLYIPSHKKPGKLEPYLSNSTWETEEEAAKAYDRAILHFFDNTELTRNNNLFNFPSLLPPLPVEEKKDYK